MTSPAGPGRCRCHDSGCTTTPVASARSASAASSSRSGSDTSRCRPAAIPWRRARGRCFASAARTASRRRRLRTRLSRRCRSKAPLGDEVGEHELAQSRAGDVRPAFGFDEVVAQVGWCEQPAESQRGGERLGHAPGVDDVLGGEGVHGGDRGTVVAVLGVVVVLDDQAPRPGPIEQLPAARCGKDHAGGELVRRRDDHRVEVGGRERRDIEAESVHRNPDGRQAPPFELVASAPWAGIFECHRPRPSGPQDLGKQSHPLGDAVHDEHVVRVGPDPPGTGELADECFAKCGCAPRVAVAELRIGEIGEHGSFGTQPRRLREGRQVGKARRQVQVDRRPACRVEHRHRRGRSRHSRSDAWRH